MKTNGPSVKLELSCYDCEHCITKSYCCEEENGDSGTDVSCAHDIIILADQKPRRVGDTNWRTPDWCPLREQAIQWLLATVVRQADHTEQQP